MLALETKLDDFGFGLASRKLTYSIGYRQIERNPNPSPKVPIWPQMELCNSLYYKTKSNRLFLG